MTYCSNCGREMPTSALYCPSCGARAQDYTLPPSDFSPSHFNSGITSTYAPDSSAPTWREESAPALSPPPRSGRRLAGKRGFVLIAIVVLAVLLIGITLEAEMLTAAPDSSPINTANTPLSGGQLYAAYMANASQFASTYFNRTIYIQDALDFGVSHLFSTGQFYSSVNSGTVFLVWSNPNQVDQLYAGAVVLAKCSVGMSTQYSFGGGASARPELNLNGCDLIGIQSSTTTSSASISSANL